jgi:transcriptional regulator with XRE-family HTH domain
MSNPRVKHNSSPAQIPDEGSVVGFRLQMARRFVGMTQADLAVASGVSRTSIAAYELSRAHLPCYSALAICRAANISEAFLAGEPGVPVQPSLYLVKRAPFESFTPGERFIDAYRRVIRPSLKYDMAAATSEPCPLCGGLIGHTLALVTEVEKQQGGR